MENSPSFNMRFDVCSIEDKKNVLYNFPELKGRIGVFLGKVSRYNRSLKKDLWFYRVLCTGGKTIKLIKNDLEVINES